MKIAYFDCPTGIAGNMILGALIDAGLSVKALKKELNKVKLDAYQLKISKVKKGKIAGTYVEVIINGQDKPRTLSQINSIIDKSRLKAPVKKVSKKIFGRLAKAEAKVHGTSINKVHLHEVGSTDALVDILGSVIGLKTLGIQKIYASSLPLGKGTTKSHHGKLPLPAPATVELLKGVPTYSGNIKGELVTPTGAAIITSLAERFGSFPKLNLERIGYGAGTYDFKIPNLLRIIIGQGNPTYKEDEIILVETNIDDMNPQFYDYVIDKLLSAGALEAYVTPIRMKKNRPGSLLSIMVEPHRLDRVLNITFSETTTLGVRLQGMGRAKLEREIKEVNTRYGKIRVKIGKSNGQVKNVSPEFKDCRRLAEKHKVPLKEVYEEARRINGLARPILMPKPLRSSKLVSL